MIIDCNIKNCSLYVAVDPGFETVFKFLEKAAAKTPCDPAKDAAFFEKSPLSGKAVLGAGEYGIFYPHDIHKPGRMYSEAAAAVKKVEVKVKV